jgi:NAD(P)-dependent dehydrogenase (short-subunit alcohol dehydrogenase family)
VTGGTCGTAAHAEELGRAGARVALCSRKQEACDEARSDLAAKGIDVLAQACNVSRKEELQALVEATRAKWGGIDIVVSNAAANPYFGPLTGIPDEAFDKIVTNNVKSVLWLAAMTLEDMAQRAKTTGKAGSFIVMGSIAADRHRDRAYGVSRPPTLPGPQPRRG